MQVRNLFNAPVFPMYTLGSKNPAARRGCDTLRKAMLR